MREANGAALRVHKEMRFFLAQGPPHARVISSRFEDEECGLPFSTLSSRAPSLGDFLDEKAGIPRARALRVVILDLLIHLDGGATRSNRYSLLDTRRLDEP